LRTQKLLLMAMAFVAIEGSAAAQGMFAASIGNVFGGDTPKKHGVYAIAIGGGGAHHIGSELEFSDSRHFFDTEDGTRKGRIFTLMASLSVTVPVSKVRPYGIFGFGFIRERSEVSKGGLFTSLSDEDVGYSAGGGVTYQFARYAGVRGDLRHFKVRTSSGISFQRLLVGIVLGG
jgi:opacity protein-like surface antigen